MNRRNGGNDCFDRDIFGSVSTDPLHDQLCLKDYLLQPNPLDKSCAEVCYNDTRPYITPMQHFNCNNNNSMMPLHNNLIPSSFPDIHNTMNNFVPNYNITNCGLSNQSLLGPHNDFTDNITSDDYSLLNSVLSSSMYNHHSSTDLLNHPMISEPNLVNSSVICDRNSLPNSGDCITQDPCSILPQTMLCDTSPLISNSISHESINPNMLVIPDVNASALNLPSSSVVPELNSNYSDLIASTGSYISSPVFGGVDAGMQQSKMDVDPFSPSISSNVSSVPSIELSDRTSFIPGSVDSGVVVNGSISSPFSVPESTKNGECGSINENLISPSTQRTGSERSVETTPGSETTSSDMCSPRVDLESLALVEPVVQVSNEPVKVKEKSHKGRKRKSESKKDKKLKKHQPLIVPTYQSQISSEATGIKLKISLKTPAPLPIGKPVMKRNRKLRKSVLADFNEPEEQTPWGNRLPEPVLKNIFRICLGSEATMPFLVRMSQVCRLWRRIAIEPSLWRNIDLCGKWYSVDPRVNDHNFRWLCENRLSRVQDLNLGGWKFALLPNILERICKLCPDLEGLGLMGWEDLTVDNVRYLILNCPKLQRIDLSGVYSNQCSVTRSGVAINSLLFATEEMGDRLTHLVLSDNRLAGIPNLITSLATHCPNLQLLDLSNVRTTQACGFLNIEQLQEGCQKLRILRITNSQLSLATVPIKDQIASPGFPLLEELSVAACVANSLSSITQPFIDDNAIERILKSSQKLKLLDARGCNRVTDSSLVRITAWDLTHLYLSGSYVTRTVDSGLELIVQKWSHSLVEVDFAWSTATRTLDTAVTALAEQGENSPLKILDLTGSSVSLQPVKEVLLHCPLLCSLNLTSCRGLPRGMKRLYNGQSLLELKNSFLQPPRPEPDSATSENAEHL